MEAYLEQNDDFADALLSTSSRRQAEARKTAWPFAHALVVTLIGICLVGVVCYLAFAILLRNVISDWQTEDAMYVAVGTSGSMREVVEKNHSAVSYILEQPCGQTPTEAREHGCSFDMIEMSWLPSECYDQELEAELKATKVWDFWQHSNRTGRRTWEEVKQGDFDRVFSNWDCELALIYDFLRRLKSSRYVDVVSNSF